MQYIVAWPPYYCLNGVHPSIARPGAHQILLLSGTLWALLSLHTPESPTTISTADPMRIQCCWLLAFEVDKNVSLSLCITLCQMAVTEATCLCIRSLHVAKKLFWFELTDPAHRSLDASDMSLVGGGGRMCWADRHCHLRKPNYLPSPQKSEVMLLNQAPWMGCPGVPHTKRLWVCHLTNPPDRLTHLWISAINSTWPRPPPHFTFISIYSSVQNDYLAHWFSEMWGQY